jgi:hypothetical protein
MDRTGHTWSVASSFPASKPMPKNFREVICPDYSPDRVGNSRLARMVRQYLGATVRGEVANALPGARDQRQVISRITWRARRDAHPPQQKEIRSLVRKG